MSTPETSPGRSLALEGFEQSRRERKKIEMRFAHLKRILKLGRLQPARPARRPGRVCSRCHRPEPAAARTAGRPAAAISGSVHCVA